MHDYTPLRYFQIMPIIGSRLKEEDAVNQTTLLEYEKAFHRQNHSSLLAEIQNANSDAAVQRIERLVAPGTWLPLNNLVVLGGERNSSEVISGLGKIEEKWTTIVSFTGNTCIDEWIPNQVANFFRTADIAERLRIPLICLIDGNSTSFNSLADIPFCGLADNIPVFRTLQRKNIPTIVGIYDTNLINYYHQNTETTTLSQDAFSHRSARPMNSCEIRDGYALEIYGTEENVAEGIRRYIGRLPICHPEMYQVTPTIPPRYPASDLYTLLSYNRHHTYDAGEIIARLVDDSAFSAYRPHYGPEVITGLAKLNGLPMAVIADVQGFFLNYPIYRKGRFSVGGKLYRQGLIKLCEFIALCTRDCIPIVWIQESSGIDTSDDEKEIELIELWENLAYTIRYSSLPVLEIALRSGTAIHELLRDSHALALSLGISPAFYSETLSESKPLVSNVSHDTAEKMFDEIVPLSQLRAYLATFVEIAYQSMTKHCPPKQMLLPQIIADQDVSGETAANLGVRRLLQREDIPKEYTD